MPAGAIVEPFPAWKDLSTLELTIGYRYELHQFSRANRRTICQCGIKSLGHRNPAALGTGCHNERGRLPDLPGDAAKILGSARGALNMLRAEEGKQANIRRRPP